jgi:hypothetical protein
MGRAGWGGAAAPICFATCMLLPSGPLAWVGLFIGWALVCTAQFTTRRREGIFNLLPRVSDNIFATHER